MFLKFSDFMYQQWSFNRILIDFYLIHRKRFWHWLIVFLSLELISLIHSSILFASIVPFILHISVSTYHLHFSSVTLLFRLFLIDSVGNCCVPKLQWLWTPNQRTSNAPIFASHNLTYIWPILSPIRHNDIYRLPSPQKLWNSSSCIVVKGNECRGINW